MARECESSDDDRPTAPPPALDGASARTTTTECVAWRIVADLLANVQREVAAITVPAEKRRFEAELRPLARAVTQWHTVPPQAAQSKNVLELLLQIQDALSEIKPD